MSLLMISLSLSVCSPVPTASPKDVAVEVFNTTVLRVSWTPVPPATVRGHLGGYNVSPPVEILDSQQQLFASNFS